jgi:hypothetical protein
MTYTGGWRKVYNVQLHNLYSSTSIIRIIKSRDMRWIGLVTCIDEKWNAYRILLGRPEGKKLLGKPRVRWGGHKIFNGSKAENVTD